MYVDWFMYGVWRLESSTIFEYWSILELNGANYLKNKIK